MSNAKKESKKTTQVKASAPSQSPLISHGTVLLSNLPANMPQVYTRIIRRFLPQYQRNISEAKLMEEADNATLTVEVTSREVAQQLYKRLQNAKVCGRRWKVHYYPSAETQCRSEACLVECTLVPPAPRALVERSLGLLQGFLAVVEAPKTASPGQATTHAEGAAPAEGSEEDEVAERLLLSFVDEGSALHARAVLSGRLIENSGVRMFLERRR